MHTHRGGHFCIILLNQSGKGIAATCGSAHNTTKQNSYSNTTTTTTTTTTKCYYYYYYY